MFNLAKNKQSVKEVITSNSKCIAIGLLVAIVFILGSKTGDYLIKNLSNKAQEEKGGGTYMLVEGVEIPLPGSDGQLSEEKTREMNEKIKQVAVQADTIEVLEGCKFSPPAVHVSIERGSDPFKFVNKTNREYTLFVPIGPEGTQEIKVPAESTVEVQPSDMIRITEGNIGIGCKGQNPGLFLYITPF